MTVRDPSVILDAQGRPATLYLAFTANGIRQTIFLDLVITERWGIGSAVTENPVETGVDITDNVRVKLRTVEIEGFLTNEPIEDNQWATALELYQPLAQPSRSFAPGPSLLLVPEWRSNLELRAGLTTAGGAIGGAIGGAAGSAIGAVGAAVVGAALLQGEVIDVPTQTNIGLPSPAPLPDLSVQAVAFDDEDDYVARTIQLLEALISAGQTFDVYGTKSSCVGPGGPSGLGGMAVESFSHSRDPDTGTGAAISLALKEIRVVSTSTVPTPAPSLPRAQSKTNKGNQGTFNMEDDVKAQIAADALSPFSQGVADAEGDVGALLQ